MRLATFVDPTSKEPRLGAAAGERILDLGKAGGLPSSMLGFLQAGPAAWDEARRLLAKPPEAACLPLAGLAFKAALPNPAALKDCFAFEAHAKAGAERRKEPFPEEWYELPAYFKCNPREIYGDGDEIPWPSYTRKLDYECEIACVLGTRGRDLSIEEAAKHIFGYMIFNDFSARDIQRKERALGMGPTKGKDFANAFGPWLVTADEVDPRALELKAFVNGELWSQGRFKDQHWGFPLIVSHVSQEETVYPGDVFGSGCFHGGCGMDLDRWIQPGDVVELEVPLLGRLRNTIGRPKAQVRLDYRERRQA
ncbi:MAG TPA: fumarylacetoacetate hydrolase family protein [Elusimicrobiota bacterium]|jgi:2-keto-4-pentenoate hydratase/2-oxohepta-3-ene-1,7-dioic acid hydratase in catechol pathway|nr:fumarylacetoacetate hydrolase family protein [Elusimicrobiota bacterium]